MVRMIACLQYCVKSLWCSPVLLAVNNESAWSVVAVIPCGCVNLCSGL